MQNKNEPERVKALKKGDKILCGNCGAWLSSFHKKKLRIVDEDGNVVGKIELDSHGTLETKCKRKDRGVTCNNINSIDI
jgi:hypothetical protein